MSMTITRCKPAGKPEGWYDAAGTRYFHQQEVAELEAEVASLTNNMPKSSIDLERENLDLQAEVARLISVVEGWEAWKQSMENYSHAYYERAEAAEAEVERLKQLLREYNEQIVTQEISVLTESQLKVCTPDPKHK